MASGNPRSEEELRAALILHDQSEDMSVYQPADFVSRWYALTLDITLYLPLDMVVRMPFQRFIERYEALGEATMAHALTGLLTAVPLLVYFIAPTLLWGQTLGKRIVGLRVVPAFEHKPLSFRQVVLRETVGKLLSAACFFVGFLMVHWHPRKRGLHDLVAATRVIDHREVDHA